MAEKYKFEKVRLEIIPPSEVTAQVYFTIRDDVSSTGKLAKGSNDQVSFSVTFPITKADLKTQAEAAILTKYPSATAG